MHNIKKIFTFLLIVLILSVGGFAIYRYKELEKEGKLDELFASNKNGNYIDDPLGTEIQENSSSLSKENNSKNNSENKSSEKTDDRQFIVEDKNYDDYYNKFNFNNVLLIYEGEQSAEGARTVVNTLIKDADDTLYSKPPVRFENFTGLTVNEISAENLDEYKSVLNQAKDSLGNSRYVISFEYAKFTKVVNKVVITKK